LFVFGCFDDSGNKGELTRLTGVVEVAVGELHWCALRGDGTVVCWGNNTYGQLGTEAEQDSLEAMDPVGITDEKIRGYNANATVVKGLTEVRHIAAGARHNCAILEDGTVRCWGYSASGQLGNGEFSLDTCEGQPCSREPVEVKGLDNVVELALGLRFSCARRQNGALSCWGSGVTEFASDLERCDQEPCAIVPVRVPLEQDVIQLMAGYTHVCALLADGTVVCWGDNSVGQIGVSNPPYQSVRGVNLLTDVLLPSEVSLEEPAERISIPGSFFANRYKTCARVPGGALYCWGKNDLGQLGIGGETDEQCWTSWDYSIACSTHPMKVAIEVEVDKYVFAENSGCAIAFDGQLYCWGKANEADLGADAEIEDRCDSEKLCSKTPVSIPTGTPIVDVAMGSRYTCSLRDDDEIDCWGWDFPHADQDFSKEVDCSSSKDPCSVERHFTDRAKEFFINFLDQLCVLTQKGEIHCVSGFNVSKRSIRSAPVWVYQ